MNSQSAEVVESGDLRLHLHGSPVKRTLYFVDVLMSVAVCYIAFAFFGLVDWIFGRIASVLYRSVAMHLPQGRAVLGITLTGIGLLATAIPWPWLLAWQSSAATLARGAVFTALLALLFVWVPLAVQVPPTLEEIRQQIGSDRFVRWVAVRMRNPLDSVWLRPLLGLLALSAPSWLAVVLPTVVSAWTILWFTVVVALASETIATFEHANGHYQFFTTTSRAGGVDRAAFGLLRISFEFLLDLMLARIPRWYGVEHVLVHHVEDNGPADLQSTEPYDRASFIDFARCANRFALSGMLPLDVIRYLSRRRRWKGLRSLLLGLCVFYTVMTFVWLWNPGAAVAILALRYVNLIRGSLSFFQEHGLIDPSEPGNIYRNSLHYINTANCHATLGEDPHIEHHLHPGRHWSTYIKAVELDLEQYSKEEAIGFLDGPGRAEEYYRLLWAGRYADLARMFVIFGKPNASLDEVASLLKARTRPVGGFEASRAMRSLDSRLGRVAGLLLPRHEVSESLPVDTGHRQSSGA